jgi:hypothetical protein
MKTAEIRASIEAETLKIVRDEIESADISPSPFRDGILAACRQRKNVRDANIDLLLSLPRGPDELRAAVATIEAAGTATLENIERLELAMSANSSTAAASKINSQRYRLAALQETRKRLAEAKWAMKSRLQNQPAAPAAV